jgi:hypothetical protein
MTSGTSKGLNFAGFSGYYDYMSYNDGYGGFNYFADFFYMNDSTWTNPNGVGYQAGWCDTGYQNEAAMSHAHSLGWIYQYGLLDSANGQTFTLTSMNVAASFSKNAAWYITSYTEKHGALYVKATDTFKVSFSGKNITLSTLGNPGDFKNIAGVGFQLVDYGKGGNTCTYGYPVVGAQLAIGNVKVKWSQNSEVKDHNVRALSPYLQLHQLTTDAHVGAVRPGNHHGGQHSDAHYGSAYHAYPPSQEQHTGVTSHIHFVPDHFF